MIRFIFTRKPVDYWLKAIDEVSANDITSVAKKLLSSPLTMVSHGDGNFFPITDELAKRAGQGRSFFVMDRIGLGCSVTFFSKFLFFVNNKYV